MKKITIIGNLGKDATVSNFDGSSALQFSVAVTEKQKVNGSWTDVTTWVSCSNFGKPDSLNKILPHLVKGKKVYVEGTFKMSVYNDTPQIQCVVSNLCLC